MADKFIYGRPEEGTLTLGVVFHVVRERDIRELTGYEPIGYVIESEEEED
jgi:hypothetical protein